MKTIYDRLNPEILASINENKERYPLSTKSLINSLQRAIDWSELRICEISSIITYSHESFLTLSHRDILWGDKFLIKDE